MKLGKVVAGVIFLAVIVVGALAYYLLTNINGIVRDVVETEGPKVTSTVVKLPGVDIRVFDGRGELSRFQIANPAGFKEPYAFVADNIVLDLDTKSITQDVIVIDNLTVDGIHIVAEQKGLTTNIQTLLDSVKQFSQQFSGGAQSEAADSAVTAPQKKIAIRQLVFKNNDVRLVTEKHGEYTLTMPTIEQSNVGDPAVGLTPAQLGVALLRPVLDQAKDTAKDKLKSIAKEELRNKISDKTKAKIDAARESVKDALGDQVGEDSKEGLKKLKSLF